MKYFIAKLAFILFICLYLTDIYAVTCQNTINSITSGYHVVSSFYYVQGMQGVFYCDPSDHANNCTFYNSENECNLGNSIAVFQKWAYEPQVSSHVEEAIAVSVKNNSAYPAVLNGQSILSGKNKVVGLVSTSNPYEIHLDMENDRIVCEIKVISHDDVTEKSRVEPSEDPCSISRLRKLSI